MAWEVCECGGYCPRCGESSSPPRALSSGSGSSEVEGHSGDSFREASSFWDLTDGEKEEAFRASSSRASEGWGDWAGTGRVPVASNTIAVPRAPAVAIAPGECGDRGASTSDSMSIPPSSPLADVMLADGGRALDCSACCLPLKPPIFQCDRGHAVCLACLNTHLRWDGPGAAARCNVSGGHDTDGYRQNKPLEEAVKAIRVPCPYGCTSLLTRYFLPTHRRSCNYAPRASCPRDACGFVGSAEALLDHFISEEKWPYTAENQAGKGFDIRLWGGFNVVGAVRGTSQHLLVLHVTRRPFGTTLSAICICPQPKDISWSRPPPDMLNCKLELHFPTTHSALQTSGYEVRTSFDVPCTNPVNGFPDPDDFFQFFVPKSAHSGDNAAIGVTASITIG